MGFGTKASAMVCGGLIVCAAWTGCGAREHDHQRTGTPKPSSALASTAERTVMIVSGERFEAVVHCPTPSLANGWGVLLIGGGLGNDLDWVTPGMIHLEGGARRVTITGDPHADAPVISADLAGRGFVVVRWSTIAIDDPLAGEWPVRSTPRTPEDLLEQCRAALALLRGVRGVRAERIALVGHSLGAARAFTIAAEDDLVCGVVALSPAYFTPETPLLASFVRAGMRHGLDVAAARGLPVLALFGTLDRSRVVDAAGSRAMKDSGAVEGLDVVCLNGLGHQLGPQEGDLFGPIDPGAVDHIGRWLERLAGRE
ncbi:MAG: dienelactone hydrolase family protein [Phycisphaeraceae bacterium]|nr:MAG: dienelactone hydrolase family protein [Phycisphaeraceae bacterium]